MISIPGRIPIHIFPLFWLLIVALGWLNSETILGTAIWAVVITISVLIHEYGHALTARIFGQEAEINLVGLGGLTKRTGPKIKKWQEFFVILDGPLAGFALFFIAYKLQPIFNPEQYKIIAYGLKVGVYVNLFWTVLNLLPILPLDGGHLMRVVLEGVLGVNGLKVSMLISIGIAAAVSLLLFLDQSFLGGALFLMFAFESYRSWTELRHLTPQDANTRLQDILKNAQTDLKEGRENEALSKLLYLREQAKKGVLFVISTQLIARILTHQGHFKQAYEWLLPIENQLSVDYLHLLQQLAFRLKEWEQAIRIGTKAYHQQQVADIALINALSNGILGKAKPAVGWLNSAIQSGLSNVSEVLSKKEFDSIRETPEFQSLKSK